MDLVATKAYPSERRPIRHLDPVLLLAVLSLAVVGLFMVYSATHQSLSAVGLDPDDWILKQPPRWESFTAAAQQTQR